jgi:hypothetical protein
MENNEILKNNGEIIEYRFYQYFHTKDAENIYNFVKFIKNNAYPSWKNVAVSKDRESQIILFLLSRYTMALFSFLINIKNDVQLKKIIMDSDILDVKVKSYIIKRYYLYILNDSASILENWYPNNAQIKKSIRKKYDYYGKAILWGFRDRMKKFKSLFKASGLPKRYIHLNKDVIYFLQYFGRYGHKYEEITVEKNSYCISGDDWFVNITFNKKKNIAEVYWGAGLGPLAGCGSTIEFIKENNIWKKSRELSRWIS